MSLFPASSITSSTYSLYESALSTSVFISFTRQSSCQFSEEYSSCLCLISRKLSASVPLKSDSMYHMLLYSPEVYSSPVYFVVRTVITAFATIQINKTVHISLWLNSFFNSYLYSISHPLVPLHSKMIQVHIF